jgi:hypothetical protein
MPARDIVIDDAEDREPQPSPAGLLPTHPRVIVVVIAADTLQTHVMVSFQSKSVNPSSRLLARGGWASSGAAALRLRSSKGAFVQGHSYS